jgi:polyferredoxin
MIVRTFTVIEAVTLALWVGSLAGFAFVFAPIAFGIVTDVAQFGRVTAGVLYALTTFGTICGALAIVAALVRSGDPAQRRSAFARVIVIAAMIGLAQYEARAVVPRMEAAIPSLAVSSATPQALAEARARFRVEHNASTKIYGTVFLLGILAIGLAALGRPAQSPAGATSAIPTR